MEKTEELKKLGLTDDEIMECLIVAQERKMDAARLVIHYAYPNNLTILEAFAIVTAVKREWNNQ